MNPLFHVTVNNKNENPSIDSHQQQQQAWWSIGEIFRTWRRSILTMVAYIAFLLASIVCQLLEEGNNMSLRAKPR